MTIPTNIYNMRYMAPLMGANLVFQEDAWLEIREDSVQDANRKMLAGNDAARFYLYAAMRTASDDPADIASTALHLGIPEEEAAALLWRLVEDDLVTHDTATGTFSTPADAAWWSTPTPEHQALMNAEGRPVVPTPDDA